MVEAHDAVVGVLEVGPCLAGECHHALGELGVVVGVVQATQAWNVMAGDSEIGGVAEACHRPQGHVGESSRWRVAP